MKKEVVIDLDGRLDPKKIPAAERALDLEEAEDHASYVLDIAQDLLLAAKESVRLAKKAKTNRLELQKRRAAVLAAKVLVKAAREAEKEAIAACVPIVFETSDEDAPNKPWGTYVIDWREILDQKK